MGRRAPRAWTSCAATIPRWATTWPISSRSTPTSNARDFSRARCCDPVPEPTLEGQIIGSYTLDRLLGEGGMGSVWLAHRSDGLYESRVAIKLLNPALLGPGGIERFRREGRALGRLAHPNIARLIDAGVTGAGQPYLVLEFVEGETINALVRRARTRRASARAAVP